jgi:hypothetical protein
LQILKEQNIVRKEVLTMAEYYEKQTLLEFVKDYTPNFGGTTSLQCVERAIEHAPTVDAVEVVRCSECQHWGGVTFGFVCRKFSGENTKICMHADGYCSYGERRSI